MRVSPEKEMNGRTIRSQRWVSFAMRDLLPSVRVMERKTRPRDSVSSYREKSHPSSLLLLRPLLLFASNVRLVGGHFDPLFDSCVLSSWRRGSRCNRCSQCPCVSCVCVRGSHSALSSEEVGDGERVAHLLDSDGRSGKI